MFFFCGCIVNPGIEIGKLDIYDSSLKKANECTLILEKDSEIKIWSDIDIECKKSCVIDFKIDVLIDGVFQGQLKINPFDKKVTINEFKTINSGLTSWRFQAKNAVFKVKKNGKYTFIGAVLSMDEGVLVRKAHIILYR
jgi:hypothetical protein